MGRKSIPNPVRAEFPSGASKPAKRSFNLKSSDCGSKRSSLIIYEDVKGVGYLCGNSQMMGCRNFHVGLFSRICYVALTAAILFNVSFAVKRIPLGSIMPLQLPASSSILRRADAASPLMDVFQVSPPVAIPGGALSQCEKTLMVYSFGNSYGKPFVGQYQPPQCDFNRVVMNFTVTSAGRQFDRLAIMYLGDTEIWRTSTAEPTAKGIIWTYMKDVSNYLALWKQPQTLIFDLGNIVDKTYTGPFNTTLTTTFFSVPIQDPPADIIFPVSARRSTNGSSSAWNVPETRAVNSFSIPRNVKKAVFSLSACGQMDEEFWWSNVLSSTTQTFTNNTLLGFSPFREVQLLIDGELAGVSWPFPVIFTGGVVPGFWRPMVGIDTFDLREDEIDITPWLSVLSDGKDHTYEIQVVGLTDDGMGNGELTTVGSYWVVTGKLFLWLDEPGSVTSGSPMNKFLPDPKFFLTSQTTKAANRANGTLNYQVLAQRQLSFSSVITTSEGSKPVSWMQTLSYSNIGKFEANGNNQTNNQMTSGADVSSNGYSRKFAYPLWAFSATFIDPASKAMGIDGKIDRGKNIQVLGRSTFPTGLESYVSQGPFDGMSLATRQNGTAGYKTIPARNQSVSWGGTEQVFVFSGIDAAKAGYPQVSLIDGSTPLYSRHVLAVNGTVVGDTVPNGPRNFDQTQVPFNGVERNVMQEFAMIRATDVVGGKPIPGSSGW